MMKASGDLRKELESCAYAVFEDKGVADEIRPEFLKIKQELRADFKEYAVENKGALYKESQNITDPTSRLCITYSLLEYVGDAFPKSYVLYLKEKMLADYLGMLLAVRIIEKSSGKEILLECAVLILPMVLPLILESGLMHSKLEYPDMFNNIVTAENLLDVFFNEYKDLEITSFDYYLAWLYQSVFFTYILWHQDCTGLTAKQIESFTVFIKAKGANLESKDLLAGNNLSNFQQSLGLMLELDSIMLPENEEVYKASKSLLFSLVLEPLLPLPLQNVLTVEQKEIFVGCFQEIGKHAFSANPFSERQRLDVYIALFSLESINEKHAINYLKYFTAADLAQIVRRIKSEVLPISSHFDCLQHLAFILQKIASINISAAGAEYISFLEETKDDFNDMFKGAMSKTIQEFYSGIDGAHKSSELSKTGENKIVVLKMNEFQKLFMLLTIHKNYKNIFVPAKELLQEFSIINFDFMTKNKLWRDSSACFTFKEITKELIKDGIKSSKIEFFAIKRAFENLIKKLSAPDEAVLTADDLVFWENLSEVFPAMQMNVKAWISSERQEIDELFLELLENMRSNEDDSHAILEVKLCISMLDIVSSHAGFEFYQYTEKALRVINKHAINSSTDVGFQLPLIKRWLLDDSGQGDEVSNSEVLRQVDILSQVNMPLANRVLYLSQLAEILYLIMKHAPCFYLEEELYSKIAEISEFVLLERDLLYSEISVMDADPAQHLSFGKEQKFLDQDLIVLLRKKMPAIKLESFQGKVASRNNNYTVLDVTDIFFTDKMIVNCNDVMFSLPIVNIPPLNILNAQVREYKDKFYLCADGGAGLVPITPAGTDHKVTPDENMSDDQLCSLFENPTGKSTPSGKKKAKNKKNKKARIKQIKEVKQGKESVSATASLADMQPEKTGKNKKYNISGKGKISKELSLVSNSIAIDEPQAEKLTLQIEADLVTTEAMSFESAAAFLFKSTVDPEQLVKLVQEYSGFKIDVDLQGNNVEVALGESKMSFAVGEYFVGPQKLQQDLSDLPARFLKSTGSDSFASLVYSADGKIVAVAPAAALLNYFELPTIGVKKGKIAKAVERLQASLLNSIQDKLKVIASITATKLSLTVETATTRCDLCLISADQLWPELLQMHMLLLQQLYGGNIALSKIILDEDSKVIAIDRSDILSGSNVSLQPVEVASSGVLAACEEFFKPFDSTSFKFFKNLTVKEVEFILKLMQHADSNLMIYGHPVVEHHYGDMLRVLGMEKQPMQQLVVRLDGLSEISGLCDMLTSPGVGAVIQGIKEHAIYCNYQGVRVTVCLTPDYMHRSIFNGDHFCSELEKDTLAYSASQANPSGVGPVVLPYSNSGVELFKSNSYVLRVALSWHKIMGKLGGGLRQILQNLGFVSVIAAPDLEGITWEKTVASKEFLPEARGYLQAIFHLESGEDAHQVLEEVTAMMKGV